MSGETVKARVIKHLHDFSGKPKNEDFELVEEEVDGKSLKNGDVMFEAVCFSVDPYLRVESVGDYKPGGTMQGTQVARVIASKNGKYPVGTEVVINAGWRTHTIVNPDTLPQHFGGIQYLPDLLDLPKSLALGACGMPGVTAYFGLLELCKPKEGETVVVNAAAGAVGSLVGQIAKIKGCNVIGYAGSDEKVEWLKNELGFDHAYNYKTVDLAKSLDEAAPKGVDCYFDNVGGEFSSIVRSKMNLFGRVAVCGCISMYNEEDHSKFTVPAIEPQVLFKQLKIEGFIVVRWKDKWYAAAHQMAKWITEGKIKYREHVTVGFENIPTAFIELFDGKNTGKAIIKIT
ncbi:unnamed protein product [Cyprideis torosa]|uniref:Prostaglandin reductase 1 n=1 Tax=Cyprideis torosa TaxID=163714 RepID=A0A7R8WQI4_9CRUS|nr:unnamed protein product [Cyprideis torosa]CAG0901801.1 unnamed protein product [Cyprideis torosa]